LNKCKMKFLTDHRAVASGKALPFPDGDLLFGSGGAGGMPA
jgi:hypothetical protein